MSRTRASADDRANDAIAIMHGHEMHGRNQRNMKELVMPAMNEATRNLADTEADTRPGRRIDVVSLYPKDMNIYGD